MLEDEADVAPLRRRPGGVLAGDQHPAGVGRSSPAITRSSVDLPPPLGPSRAVSEPSGTSSDTSSSATKSPKRLETRFDDDAHACRPSLGLMTFMASSGDQRQQRQDDRRRRRRRSGRSAEKRSSTCSVAVSVRPDSLPDTTLTAPNSPERPRGGEHHAVGHAPADRGQRHAEEGLERGRRPASRPPAPARCRSRAAPGSPRAPRRAATRTSWPGPCRAPRR